MPWTVEYIAEKKMALVLIKGQIRDDDLKEQVTETIRILREQGASFALVDCTNGLSEATLPAIYYLPDQATMSGAPWHLRVALVLPTTKYRMDTYRFFELVFKSAGYDVGLFDTRDAAENWLLNPVPVKVGIQHVVHV